jgi:predicted transposase YbfD/YdcC
MVIEMEEKNLFNKCEIYFSLVEDYRNESYITYPLSYIIFMVMCGIICGCKDLEEMVEVLENKIEVIQKYIKIERIPCLATFSNVLSVLNVLQLELCVIAICKNVINDTLVVEEDKEIIQKEIREISIDGKAIRSTNNHGDPEKALQIVTAYDVNTKIPVAQTEIKDKTNEITAGRDILNMFELKNAVITADAIHCQKETIKQIVDKGGDYVIQLKENQKNLYKDISLLFDDDLSDKSSSGEYLEKITLEMNGGRIEKRSCYVLQGLESLNFLKDRLKEWENVKQIFCIKREIEKNGKKSEEKSYYLTSLMDDPDKLMRYARNHWKIESMHWLLDVHFKEDDCPVRSENTQKNLNLIRKLAIKLHTDYIAKTNPKRKTIISSIRNCLTNDKKFETFLNTAFM